MSRSRLHGSPHSSARGLGGPEQNLALSGFGHCSISTASIAACRSAAEGRL
jgi:hypothetical protein